MEHHFKQNDTFKFSELETIEKDGKRYYVTPKGNFPSVTTFLSATKSDEDKKVLQEWRERVGAEEADKIVERAKVAGTELHLMIEKYLQNEAVPKGSIQSEWMFLAVKPFLKKHITEVYAQEVPLYSHKLKLAGRTDCIGMWNGKLAVIDFKTAAKERTEEMIQDYFIQCTAYAIMFGEITGTYIKRFAILMVDKKSFAVQVFEGNTADYVEPLLKRLHEFNKAR